MQTPVWGGSTESMTNPRLCCPLRNCRQSLNSGNLMEHLSQQHNGPLIHFYRAKVEIPLPFPFDAAVYVLHQRDEIFLLQVDEISLCCVRANLRVNNFGFLFSFFQSEDEKVWMSNVDPNCGINWEWMLQASGEASTDLNLRKEVASLRDPYELGPHNVALLPKSFTGSRVMISLIELDADDGCVKI